MSIDKFRTKIFNTTKENFEELALQIFQYQYFENPVYQEFIHHLGIKISDVNSISQIPFMPVSFFRYHKVLCKGLKYSHVFKSSGTSDSFRAIHYIHDIRIYENSFHKAFNMFYDSPEKYVILALLPNYLEQKQSSLVYMVSRLMENAQEESGFYLNNFDELYQRILTCQKKNKRILLLGVSYALLDFTENYQPDMQKDIVMETGGMKGRRVELLREELHHILSSRLNCNSIHSEYGMTELLSQAYSSARGIFIPPPWMKVFTRDNYDPLQLNDSGVSGNINIIDLANVASCSFIATEDTGIVFPDGSFNVTGRMDYSPVRGCSLLYQE